MVGRPTLPGRSVQRDLARNSAAVGATALKAVVPQPEGLDGISTYRSSVTGHLAHSWNAFNDLLLRVAPQGAALMSIVMGAGFVPVADLLGASIGMAGWAAAGVGAAVKANLLLAIPFEFAMVKAVDLGLTTALRRHKSRAVPFYVAMARVGIDSGWNGDGKAVPFFVASTSYTASGGVDFIVGCMLGSNLRKACDQLLEKLPSCSAEEKDAFASEFRERAMRALGASLFQQAKGQKFRSPLVRHLAAAVRGEHNGRIARRIEEHLLTQSPGDPLGGTLMGRAAFGMTTGSLLGSPILGALVAMGDSLADGLMTKAAVSGRVATLGRVKAQLVHQGWKGSKKTGPGRIAGDLYAPIGREFRDLGSDLRAMGERAKARLDGAAAPVDEFTSWVCGVLEIGADSAEITSLRRWLGGVTKMPLDAAESELDHHAKVPLMTALGADFPETALRAERLAEDLSKDRRAAVFAVMIQRPLPPDDLLPHLNGEQMFLVERAGQPPGWPTPDLPFRVQRRK